MATRFRCEPPPGQPDQPPVRPTRFSNSKPAPNVVVACSYDPLGLQGPLAVWLRRLTGQRCAVHWIGYGLVLDALSDPGSVWCTNYGLNVLILRWSDFGRSCAAKQDENVAAAIVTALEKRCGPTLVLLPPLTDVCEGPSPSSALTAATDNVVAARISELRAIAGVTVVAGEELRGALDACTDRTWHLSFLDRVAHAPYSPAANSLFALLICRELNRVLSPTRKVYALDCDDTLWGGAVGELGAHGVVLSEEYLVLQRHFVAQQARGALICLISRNHESDVRDVLRKRAAELVLREEHVVAIRASWDIRKGEALLDLARTLCLDLSSFVFVDDSARECADVAATCGDRGVAIVHVPRDPVKIGPYLQQCWVLDGPPGGTGTAPTSEDAARTMLYRQLDERKSFVATSASAVSSMDAFAASLNLQVDISPLDAINARRAAQLTERTNQHNACKAAATEVALMRACANGCLCLVVDARDRFGHHGLVGLIVTEPSPTAVLGEGIVGESSEREGDGCGCTVSVGSGQIESMSELATVSTGSVDAGVLTVPEASAVLHVRCWLLSCRCDGPTIEHGAVCRPLDRWLALTPVSSHPAPVSCSAAPRD